MTPDGGKWLERGVTRTGFFAVLAALNVFGFAYFAWHLYVYGYLPSPFIPDKADTFMDFFHPLFWSDVPGKYLEWGAVYPPLNFVLLSVLKSLAFDDGVVRNGFDLRAHSGHLQLFFYPICCAVIAFVVSRRYWAEFSLLERLFILIGSCTCVPILFVLERANLIILALILIPVVINKGGFSRILSIAVLTNIKPYFLLLCLVYVAKRQWQNMFFVIVTSGVIFVLCGVVVGSEFTVFFSNLFSYSQRGDIFSPLEVLSLPSSVSAFSYVLNSEGLARNSSFVLAGAEISIISMSIELAKWAAMLTAMFTIVRFSDRSTERFVVAVSLVLISNLGVSVGGYTAIFYIPLLPVFLERKNVWLFGLSVIVLFIPYDTFSIFRDAGHITRVYLSGRTALATWALTVGAVVRPLANLALLVAMSADATTWNFARQPRVDVTCG